MDIKNYYVEAGNGFPLILLHGNGEDHSYFEHQIGHFYKKYRVIAVDTRGHGQTPRGIAPFTIAQFVEDLKYFFDELGIEKANILGFSDGGNIAIMFAMKYPEYVENLILNGANLDPKGIKTMVHIPIVLRYQMARLRASSSDDAKEKMELLGLMVKEPHLTPRDLKNIKARTLVVAGTDDMIKEGHTEMIFRSIENAQIVLISGDHFVANKNPEEFNRVVEEFLNE